MESEVVLFPGLKVTWVVEHNMLHMMEVNPTGKWLSVGYHKVQF